MTCDSVESMVLPHSSVAALPSRRRHGRSRAGVKLPGPRGLGGVTGTNVPYRILFQLISTTPQRGGGSSNVLERLLSLNEFLSPMIGDNERRF